MYDSLFLEVNIPKATTQTAPMDQNDMLIYVTSPLCDTGMDSVTNDKQVDDPPTAHPMKNRHINNR